MAYMKNLMKCLTVSAGLCLAAGQLHGAETNLVQSIKFSGILYYQGATVTNSTGTTVTKSTIRSVFNNRSLINRFGQVAAVTFSSSAKLLLVTELNGNDVYVVVQDGTNRVDVSSYFDVDFENDPVVETSSLNLSTSAFSATRYQLAKVKLHDPGVFGSLGIHFDLDGLATVKRKSFTAAYALQLMDRPSGKLAGKGKSDNVGGGDSDFLAAINFSVSGGTVEVRQ
jgi:hypothetical protein